MAPHRYDVSLMVVTNCESSAGTMLRRAWGRMMYRYICGAENPWERAASYWPAGTLAKPPRTISATEAAVNSVKASTAAGRGGSWATKNVNIIHKSSGVFLNSST